MASVKGIPYVFLDLNTIDDFFAPGAPLFAAQAVPARHHLRDLSRSITRAGLIVLAGVDLHLPDDPEFDSHALLPHALEGSPGRQKIAETWVRGVPVIPVGGQRKPWPKMQEIRQRGGQIVLEKNRLDLFSNPALSELLRNLHPAELILYGALLEHDIHATAFTARDLGYEVSVASDACLARDEASAAASREGMLRRHVRFETTDEITLRILLWKKRQEREKHMRSSR